MSKRTVQKSSSCSVAPKGKSWEQMSRKQRRIAVAEDVIANIYAKRLRVRTGSYVNPDSSYNLDALLEFGFTNEQIMEKLKEKCTVCAKGALMICKVAKFNNFDLMGEDINNWDGNKTIEVLDDAFDKEELDQIEAAFEGNPEYLDECDDYLDDDDEDRFDKDYGHWRRNFPDAEDRLLAIAQNIVDNDGTFKPKMEYILK